MENELTPEWVIDIAKRHGINRGGLQATIGIVDGAPSAPVNRDDALSAMRALLNILERAKGLSRR